MDSPSLTLLDHAKVSLMAARNLSISRHGLRRMDERGVTMADIVSALGRPMGHPSPGDGGNLVVDGYASEGRLLRVILTADEETVVTVMWRER